MHILKTSQLGTTNTRMCGLCTRVLHSIHLVPSNVFYGSVYCYAMLRCIDVCNYHGFDVLAEIVIPASN